MSEINLKSRLDEITAGARYRADWSTNGEFDQVLNAVKSSRSSRSADADFAVVGLKLRNLAESADPVAKLEKISSLQMNNLTSPELASAARIAATHVIIEASTVYTLSYNLAKVSRDGIRDVLKQSN